MESNRHYFGEEVKKIKEQIKFWIEDNKLSPGTKLPSQNEFVKLFRCSHTTVHRAMRLLVDDGLLYRRVGQGTFLSANLNKTAINNNKSLKPARLSIISVVSMPLPDLGSPAYELMAEAEEVLLNHVQNIELKQITNFNELSDFLSKKKFDGIIIDWKRMDINTVFPMQIEYLLDRDDTPVIHCFHYYEIQHALRRVVEIDNSRIGAMGIQHLFELGHRSIMLIATEKGHGFDKARISAAVDFAKSFGLNLISFKYQNGGQVGKNEWIEAGHSAYEHFKNLPTEARPTAIFAINDKAALAFIERAKEDGVKIPEDISVLGVDNEIGLYVKSGINLTSIDPCRADVGARAAEWLLDILNGNEKNNCSKTIRSQPKLIKRQSTMEIKSF